MRLELHGWLHKDCDDVIGLAEHDDDPSYRIESIPDSIQKTFGYQRYNKGLGQKITYLPKIAVSIFYSDKECTLDQVQTEFLFKTFGGCSDISGELKLQLDYVGYSEWTITGLDLEQFTVGGHNIDSELSSHLGEFCWLIISDD